MHWSFRFGASSAPSTYQSPHGIHSPNLADWLATCSLAAKSIHAGGICSTSNWCIAVSHSFQRSSSIWFSSPGTSNSCQFQPLKRHWPIPKSSPNSSKASVWNQLLPPSHRWSSFMSSMRSYLNIIWPAHLNWKMKVLALNCCFNMPHIRFGLHSSANSLFNIKSQAFRPGSWPWSASCTSAVWYSNDLQMNWNTTIVSTQPVHVHWVSTSFRYLSTNLDSIEIFPKKVELLWKHLINNFLLIVSLDRLEDIANIPRTPVIDRQILVIHSSSKLFGWNHQRDFLASIALFPICMVTTYCRCLRSGSFSAPSIPHRFPHVSILQLSLCTIQDTGSKIIHSTCLLEILKQMPLTHKDYPISYSQTNTPKHVSKCTREIMSCCSKWNTQSTNHFI